MLAPGHTGHLRRQFNLWASASRITLFSFWYNGPIAHLSRSKVQKASVKEMCEDWKYTGQNCNFSLVGAGPHVTLHIVPQLTHL